MEKLNRSNLFDILNGHVFNNAKSDLVSSVSDNPDRFIGIFRSTTPRLKLVQNILQSREIRFGDALEKVMQQLFLEIGLVPLAKSFLSLEQDKFSCDHYLVNEKTGIYYLIEQKMRDDHDSTKKRGQWNNFSGKINYLRHLHGSNIVGIMYFLDPTLVKNRNFYNINISIFQDAAKIPMFLFYNGELFDYLNHAELWVELTENLALWRNSLGDSIDLDFDVNPLQSLEELRLVKLSSWEKLFSNDLLWRGGVIAAMFPQGSTLRLKRQQLLDSLTNASITGAEFKRVQRLLITLDSRLEQYYV